MNNNRTFLKCEKCGNIIGVIKDGGGEVICCGEPMLVLKPGAVDASIEKHVPVCTRKGNLLKAEIGAAPHPMSPEHFIEWIAVCSETVTQRKQLAPGEPAVVEFYVEDSAVMVYAYCNLHGLWQSEI